MNLRLAKGKVPIRGRGETPYLMVAFPDRELFNKLFAGVHGDNRDKYWNIVNTLSAGSTMQEAGKPYALTRERVRQIENSAFDKLKRQIKRLTTPHYHQM